LTLRQVVLNLERKGHSPGLSYVAISRVKKLSSIMFETPFDLSKGLGSAYTPVLVNS
jgi:hypothetical protein